MRNLTLKFKDEVKRENTKNLIITCVIDLVINGSVMIEFWDPQKDYHFCKPTEVEISEWEPYSKSSSLSKEDSDKLRSRVSYWKKYSNKRVLMEVDDFWNTFDATKCTYLDRTNFLPSTIKNWKGLFSRNFRPESIDRSQEFGNCKTILCVSMVDETNQPLF